MDILPLIGIFVIGAIAAFIGVNVGGGGLISIPALIFFGLPPQIAIATNRLASLGIGLGGLAKFRKHNKVDYKLGITGGVIALFGAYFGAQTMLKVPNDVLQKLVAIFILVILGVMLLDKKIGLKKTKITKLKKGIGYVAFIFLGFWGAFFGAAMAIFSMYTFVFLFGKTFLESAGTKTILTFFVAGLSVVIYAKAGVINWAFGIAVLLGMLVGGYWGAHHGLKKGDTWVKNLFIVMVVVSAIKLLL